ncbi:MULTISPECIES: hypothetical protein [unclassified Rubrivivax]|uniref:hypothetical protein n=1 Tax=unclassified Rubrivivax TaxID=2649762 RepID=UPI0013E92644|nr:MULTISPECIES: hypothetical protein [unclassified Rubrivivax]MCC9597754.1 hypothetical protein [Rubrivivax sp. JA1055]MCC9645989.1 hypothetical protein [Rubrivivax sp. JA1029]MCD0421380.1 hypothetical protein [Rubrivivax sp. JA1024]
MLEGLKRLFTSRPSSGSRRWDAVSTWAETRQWAFRGVRDHDGFVVEGRFGGTRPWRLEWGPSQRPYIDGAELRLRSEVGLPADLQALVMDRTLQQQLERQVFDQYVEGVQTRIDDQTPPEMRWLVMFPRLTPAEMGALREQYVAMASAKPWLQQWLGGPLAARLAASPAGDRPFVLMAARGRLTLRTAVAEPSGAVLEAWLALFETAVSEAWRTGVEVFGAEAMQPGVARSTQR